MSKRVRFPANSSTKFTQKKTRHKRRVFAIAYYFFKNVGILIDCSFTWLTGVLGVCNVGAVPAVLGCAGFA
jgi:hypothetical protein